MLLWYCTLKFQKIVSWNNNKLLRNKNCNKDYWSHLSVHVVFLFGLWDWIYHCCVRDIIDLVHLPPIDIEIEWTNYHELQVGQNASLYLNELYFFNWIILIKKVLQVNTSLSVLAFPLLPGPFGKEIKTRKAERKELMKLSRWGLPNFHRGYMFP